MKNLVVLFLSLFILCCCQQKDDSPETAREESTPGLVREPSPDVDEKSNADIEVKIIENSALVRNLTSSKLVFFQLCFGINTKEKQSCILLDFELLAGEETELPLDRYFSLDESVNHLLLSFGYDKEGADLEYQHYFTLGDGADELP